MFFLELVEKYTRQTAWAFLGNIFQFGKVISLHRAFFIRKNISSSNRKQKELQEKCKGITGPKRLGDIWVTGGEIVIITNFSKL